MFMYENGVLVELTPEQEKEFEEIFASTEQAKPTLEERIAALEDVMLEQILMGGMLND